MRTTSSPPVRSLVLMAATASLLVAACTAKTQGQQAIAPSPQPTADQRPCGEDGSLALAGLSPAGRTYHDGETLGVNITYHGPGCRAIGASFDGYYAAGTAWYAATCAPLCHGRVLGVFKAQPTEIDGGGGTIELVADATPRNDPLTREAPIEGFTLCDMVVVMHDGSFGGHHVDEIIGAPC
jgi:hypothetical protein